MQVVSKEVFRRVEFELHSYPGNLLMLQDQREEILHSTPRKESEGRAIGHISDPTLARGVKLAGIAETEPGRWVNLIGYALSQMPQEHRKFVKLRYWDSIKSPYKLADMLHISRSAVFEWRQDIVYYVVLMATQRGLIKPIKEREVI